VAATAAASATGTTTPTRATAATPATTSTTAAASTTAALATSATATGTAAAAGTPTAPATASAGAAGAAGRATDHGVGGRAKAVARGTTERVEHRNDHHSDSYDEEGVFRRILAGLLAPESFEGSQHDEHLELRGLHLALIPSKFSAFR
jgi:hypothetical protein